MVAIPGYELGSGPVQLPDRRPKLSPLRLVVREYEHYPADDDVGRLDTQSKTRTSPTGTSTGWSTPTSWSYPDPEPAGGTAARLGVPRIGGATHHGTSCTTRPAKRLAVANRPSLFLVALGNDAASLNPKNMEGGKARRTR